MPSQIFLTTKDIAKNKPEMITKFLKALKGSADEIMTADKKTLFERAAKDFEIVGNKDVDASVALMDAMGISRAHLIGHSTGGAIGQHVALRWPERLERLVLSCSWAGPDAYFEQLFRTRREILINCGPLAYYTIGTYLAHPGGYLQAQMKDARSFMEGRMAAWPGLEVELSRLAAVAAHDLRSHVHKISQKTLCIGAADDQITPSGFTEELARLIPGAQLHLLPHGGHFCPIVETTAYNERVLQFLRSAS